MILLEELAAIIAKQREMEMRKADGQIRSIDFNDALLDSHALDITGVRRCGKSTIMRQRMRVKDTPWFYVNFESPLLTQFEMRDTIRLDALIEKSGARRLFFDEVDQFSGWEKYVRQKLDESFHVCISGSNASLLEGELGTKLTGRHISKELFPFSYEEYLCFTNQSADAASTLTYAQDGGFPRYLQTHEEVILQELFDDIVYRDVIVHNKIRDIAAVRELTAYLIENIGCRFTASRMLKPLGVASASTITQWCDWIEKAYLFFFVPIFSDSEKARLLNPKKVYCVDTGLEYSVSSRRIPNDGARFENLVYLALRRKYKDISYFDDNGECDFIIRERHTVHAAVQACTKLTDECKDREIDGLLKALKTLNLTCGTIVTLDQSDKVVCDGCTLNVTPFWEWARAGTDL
ncbi:MAG: ATP-binding protein [bacterium]|nr:ATP-binding protein [bacterium]